MLFFVTQEEEINISICLTLSPLSLSLPLSNLGLLRNSAGIWAQLQLPLCIQTPAQMVRKCKSAARLNTPNTQNKLMWFLAGRLSPWAHSKKSCVSLVSCPCLCLPWPSNSPNTPRQLYFLRVFECVIAHSNTAHIWLMGSTHGQHAISRKKRGSIDEWMLFSSETGAPFTGYGQTNSLPDWPYWTQKTVETA